MIQLTAVSAPLDGTDAALKALAAKCLRIPPDAVTACRVVRRAVDARRKDAVHFVMTLTVSVRGEEGAILKRANCPGASLAVPPAPYAAPRMALRPPFRPVVIGGGPAGLFAALTLAQAGAEPLLLERGRDVAARRQDIDAFWAGGPLRPDSNVQFGAGGAGTFSDGKLNTGIKDVRCRHVLKTFVACGAPEGILVDAKPHMGTDVLLRVVGALCAQIEALGGAIRYETAVDGLDADAGNLLGVRAGDLCIDTRAAALCIGHSARDTFEMLQAAGIAMAPKPFAIGARIEHPQLLIDRAQYGRFADHSALGAAEYRLSCHLPNGRGVYTFCMCPGGQVVAAASEAGGVVTNGMSYRARDGHNANSALLVDVRPEDFDGGDVLSGVRFQRKWERLAFALGGRDYKAPAQLVGDFLAGRPSDSLAGASPTYRPGVTPADLRACLPDFVTQAMAEGIRRFDRKIPGFASPGALLTGVETRSSSPVRIARDAQGHASLRGLFPCGEGAGYAGGIMSAAVDGIRAAEKILAYLQDEAEGGSL